MDLLNQVGKILLIKSETLTNYVIFISMSRPRIKDEDKKIKFGISLDPNLYDKIKKDGYKVSTLIEKLVREYYGK